MADFTLSDMPDTLCRADIGGSGLSLGAGTTRTASAVFIKGPSTTFQFFDSGSGTFKTVEIPSIQDAYGGVGSGPPDLCRIVTLPVLGPRAIIWHAGHIGIYAAGVAGTPNAARRIPYIRDYNDSLTYLNGGSLFVPSAGAGAGDGRICPFPIPQYLTDGFGGAGDGFATWANMPWFDATWMFPDPTGGADGGLPYPYSISPWVEAGYGDAYQGSIPTGMLTFTPPSATLPTIDVQEYLFPHPGTLKAITVTMPSTASTAGLVLVSDPAIFGAPDYFADIGLHVDIYVPSISVRDPISTDTIDLAGLNSGPDIVRQYLIGNHGTYLVDAYFAYGYGAVTMFSNRNNPTLITLP